jgi:hypothetical protein
VEYHRFVPGVTYIYNFSQSREIFSKYESSTCVWFVHRLAAERLNTTILTEQNIRVGPMGLLDAGPLRSMV